MDICALPIFNTDEHMLCHITYSDEECEPGEDYQWIVHTGVGSTITVLVLSSTGIYIQLEVPREEFDEFNVDMDFQLHTIDAGSKFFSTSSNYENMKFQNKRICNVDGKQICELSLSEEDGTWGITFYGEPYSTTLYLYYNGSYSQIEFPVELSE